MNMRYQDRHLAALQGQCGVLDAPMSYPWKEEMNFLDALKSRWMEHRTPRSVSGGGS